MVRAEISLFYWKLLSVKSEVTLDVFSVELPDMLSVVDAVEVILRLSGALDMFKRVVLNLPWSVDQGQDL